MTRPVTMLPAMHPATVMQRIEWEDPVPEAWANSRPRTTEESRRWDLVAQHMRDTARPFNRMPKYHWGLFAPEGCVVDEVWTRNWCVYPADINSPLYRDGLWFSDVEAATKVRDWKMAREKLRPFAITRLVVRAWRALPWR